jgi:formylglycine-generating enzyme required for sulfatase activity
MQRIAGDELSMGSDSHHPLLEGSRPSRRVRVASFCIDATEVTVEDYAECSARGECERAHDDVQLADGDDDAPPDRSTARRDALAIHAHQCNEGRPGREHHPINCVTHQQASQYCHHRNAGLPSEEQWELAARGAAGRSFPWGDDEPDPSRLNACGSECAAWHRRVGLEHEIQGVMFDSDDGYSGTSPVGAFPRGKTPEGVLDLAGNVLEWTRSELETPASTPGGLPVVRRYVVRGGAFSSGVTVLADSSLRLGRAPESHAHDLGFRCAVALDESPGSEPEASTL